MDGYPVLLIVQGYQGKLFVLGTDGVVPFRVVGSTGFAAVTSSSAPWATIQILTRDIATQAATEPALAIVSW